MHSGSKISCKQMFRLQGPCIPADSDCGTKRNRNQKELHQPGAWSVKTQDRAAHILRKCSHNQPEGENTTCKWVEEHNATPR